MCYANFIGLKVRITNEDSIYYGIEGEIVHISTQNEEAIYSVELLKHDSLWRAGFLEGEFIYV